MTNNKNSNHKPLIFLLSIFFLLLPPLISPLRPPPKNPCDPKTLPHPLTVRSDQLTILINGFSESRLPLLLSIASSYSSSPSVSSILILWSNPKTLSKTLKQTLESNLTSFGAPISVLRQTSDSLNSRFLPNPSILTRAVAICDDDVQIDPKTLEFAFKIWKTNTDRIVGFFPRSHDLDLSHKTWIYTVHPDKFSIVLTKFMILKTDYLYDYSCGGGEKMRDLRGFVDEMRNCEDILMNFVVAGKIDLGPVLVEGKNVRDWGDVRNEEEGEEEVREVGLSKREDHRKRRGDCIREFHRVLGRMPLKYSYGKVVESVGEQGLCKKGGKLVFCDEQIKVGDEGKTRIKTL
ncbi:nucleotide-diphospho-sugar transferases superfamily protein [Tasmannia lanceolata]|uniref:nucleotide-diphospho-sugar transferases superfamily protein n=1 Tax=Tasmannia lanceolata TaxID=3420 RepID=UPI004064214E